MSNYTRAMNEDFGNNTIAENFKYDAFQSNTFETIDEMITKLNATNSKNEKMSILSSYEKNEEVQKILQYTYDPYRKFGVSSKVCLKHQDKSNLVTDDLVELLDMLVNRDLTGHDAISAVNGFMNHWSDFAHIIKLIIDKNLKTRTDAKLINKVFPNLVPQFDVTLAQKYEDHAHKINWNNQQWFWSRKLDGVRVIARKENGVVKFFSRQGHEFTTLGIIKQELEGIIEDNFVLDGEMCVVDNDGNEDYTSIVSQIKRKDYTVQNPKFMVFDILRLDEFDNQYAEATLSERLWQKEAMFNNCKHISHLKMNVVNTHEQVVELSNQASKDGWEGIMIRRDCHYEGKRTKNLLKVKKFHDAEYIVKDVEFGSFRMIDPKSGLEKTIETLTNVMIEHKGNKVSVGSGFSLEQRQDFFADSSKIIGKEITVQYFEESTNKDGGISLRFPTVKKVWSNGRSI